MNSHPFRPPGELEREPRRLTWDQLKNDMGCGKFNQKNHFIYKKTRKMGTEEEWFSRSAEEHEKYTTLSTDPKDR